VAVPSQQEFQAQGYSPVRQTDRGGQLLSTDVLPRQLIQRDNNIRPERLLRPHLRASCGQTKVQRQQAVICSAAVARRQSEPAPLCQRRARTDDSGVSSIGEESK
jgi:hypothetical protein